MLTGHSQLQESYCAPVAATACGMRRRGARAPSKLEELMSRRPKKSERGEGVGEEEGRETMRKVMKRGRAA